MHALSVPFVFFCITLSISTSAQSQSSSFEITPLSQNQEYAQLSAELYAKYSQSLTSDDRKHIRQIELKYAPLIEVEKVANLNGLKQDKIDKLIAQRHGEIIKGLSQDAMLALIEYYKIKGL